MDDWLNDLDAQLPKQLVDVVRGHVEQYLKRNSQLPVQPEILNSLPKVWSVSDFVAQACIRQNGLFTDLETSGDLFSEYDRHQYQQRLADLLSDVTDEETLHSLLRRFRRREMVRIAWRDLAGWADLNHVLNELSWLAESCIDQALNWLYAQQCSEWGVPRDMNGEAQQLVVLAMGKLGAHELNFSSDIDLIFAYPEEGETDGRRTRSHHEFFIRLGRRLIAALNNLTADGFVFRVDMRLRPNGESGPLAISFDAMENYYQAQGREWERYALIKARPVAGDREAGQALVQLLNPFVYRRYLDFGALESLREMKGMIAAQVSRKGMDTDIKLGPGGIREIEFIGQAFQLIRGGRDVSLQQRGIRPILDQLKMLHLLPAHAVHDLLNAYDFLRRAENRIQAQADQQTQALPKNDLDKTRLAYAMGYANWIDFKQALDAWRQRVEEHFAHVVADEKSASLQQKNTDDLSAIWCNTVMHGEALARLAAVGFQDGEQILQQLQQFQESSSCRRMSEHGRHRLDRLMAPLLCSVAETENDSETLQRILGIFEKIAKRSAYLALLSENPVARAQLIKLCSASPWIGRMVAQHPILLDELLDQRTLYAPLDRSGLEAELKQQLAAIPNDDLEQQMERLRQFKQSHQLRVAAADLMNAIPLIVVSDYLTHIAETLVQQVVAMAWDYLAERHGQPTFTEKGERHHASFAVVGYGKLGGWELGYGSDLDVVFLHDSRGEAQYTDGKKQIDNAVFFARLGQRIIHLLNAQTPAGILYEVDTRLRPSGASGLLVTSMDGFADYQQTQAWTWEHQALVRARVVDGDPCMVEAFAKVRHRILTQQRDRDVLKQEVREMREKMREQLGSKKPGYFHLKQDPGGIADIEFMMQYYVLAWSKEYSEIAIWTDNIRIVQTLGQCGLLPQPDVQLLSEAYRAYRARGHQLVLQEQATVVPDSEFVDYRAEVIRIWKQTME